MPLVLETLAASRLLRGFVGSLALLGLNPVDADHFFYPRQINWRHGDIEDALLGIIMARALDKKSKKFNKMAVMRVYFGNWLRDYSQAVDLGTIKNVSYEAIRLVGG